MKHTLTALFFLSGSLAFAQFPNRTPTPNDTLKSVQVQEDGKLKFSIYAPKSSEVRVSGDFSGGFPGLMLEKSDIGVWSATTSGPVSPDVYTYDFYVDDLKVFDPKNSLSKESNSGYSNLFEVPGEENEFQALQDVPHGRVEKVWYKSETLDGVTRRLHVYLPPNYDEISKTQKLPVLYLLHGGGDNDASWTTAGRANLILDNLYAEGKIEPMIVVMPAGHTGIPGFFMGAGYWQDPACRDLVHTVIPFIDSNYPTFSDREHRAIAGLSMGGVQTLNTALWNPELFSYVFPMSTGYFPPNIQEIKDKHEDVMTNKEINNFKVFKIYMGGETDIAYQNNLNMMEMFDGFGINYQYQNGSYAHTFREWRRNLLDLAPLLFR
ncbi:esterase [Jiulongibacter sediminis]|jgi:enterochelin esterase family protein|uniref:esterase n=1 Tax=Jiulongibacter sediminis TaxID=1605367 RepID=UPI0026EB766F|nr:esterase [Jiulongibacter sediminis]